MWRYLRAEWPATLIGLLAVLGVDASLLMVPRVIRRVIDGLPTAHETSLLPTACLHLTLLGCAVWTFRFVWRYFIYGASRRIEQSLRDRLYAHCLRLPVSFFDRSKVGDLMAHVTNDLAAVREFMGVALVIATDAVIWSAATVVMMLCLDVKVTLQAMLPMLCIGPFAMALGRRIHRRFGWVQQAFSRVSERAQETLGGMMTLKVFGKESAAAQRFAEDSQQYYARHVQLARVSSAQMPVISCFASVASVLLLWFGGGDVMSGRLTLGTFVALHAYLGMLMWPMMAMGWVVNMFERGMASLDRVEKLLNEPVEPGTRADAPFHPVTRNGGGVTAAPVEPSVVPAPDAVPALAAAPAVSFRRVSFAYDGRDPALTDVSLDIPSAGRVAIIGSTGCGKSTLVSLLARLYEPPAGTVLLDGRDIRDIPLEALRSRVAVVPQESFLFSETVAENIRCGLKGASQDDVEAVARLAMIHEEILNLPQGYDTVVGERGLTLSGGQRQRVGLARALLRRAPALALDDALSMVDADTERRIMANLGPLCAGRTVIVVTHRLSAISDFPHIVVMDRGRIVEAGTHWPLLQQGGMYARMYELIQIERVLFDEVVETP